MKNLKLFILLAIIFIICAGCGGNSSTTETSATNTNSSVNTLPVNSGVTASNGETVQPAFSGETKEIEKGFPVPVNANVAVANTAQPVQQQKPNSGEMPAPDDSTYSAEMNSGGQPVETRTFRSHQTLAKIEKITLSPRDYIFKIYLKNGKIVESKSEKLKDFRVIAPTNILDAINMLPAPPKNNSTGQDPESQKKTVPASKENQ